MPWRAFAVIGAARAQPLDILVVFNDVVLMALLFFLAGLFTWRSLVKKGALGFLRGRGLRPGLPFCRLRRRDRPSDGFAVRPRSPSPW